MTFPYRTADYEEVSCNLCGGTDVEPLGWRDRNLLPVRTVMCKHDGFIFISPRMTSTWYARYYDGEYRRQMSAYHRMPMAHRPEVMIEHQLRHGRWIAAYLRRNGVAEVGSILDIGSSTGGLLRALAEEFKGASVQGVEPSGEEAEFASRNGVPTRVGLFEELDFGEGRFDLIVCSQTFNHLLNPRLSVEKVRRLLRPNGVLFLECMDFFRLCEVQGAFFNAVQIDHVSMFVPDTLKAMCEAAGLEVIGSSVLSDRDQPLEVRRAQRAAGAAWCHTRFLASPGVPRPPQPGYQKVRAEIERLALAPIKTLLKMKLRPVRRLTDRTRWRWRVDWWLRYGVE